MASKDKKTGSDEEVVKRNGEDTGKGSETTSDESKVEFGIQRIYVKDLSFEAPNAPGIFREEWHPNVNVDLQSKSSKLEDNVYEVTLTVTVTVKSNEKMAFLAEVHQSGIFTARNFTSDQLQHTLTSFCPTIIFPYAREAITDLVARGGFPQLYLAPINFDAIYQQQMQKQRTSEEQRAD